MRPAFRMFEANTATRLVIVLGFVSSFIASPVFAQNICESIPNSVARLWSLTPDCSDSAASSSFGQGDCAKAGTNLTGGVGWCVNNADPNVWQCNPEQNNAA